MLTRAEEDKLIEDGSVKIENISSATSISDLVEKFNECIKNLNDVGLFIVHEIKPEDFDIPEEDDDVEFILPLILQPVADGEDNETELCLIFNYSLENGIYSIFADVDFFIDEADELLKVQE